MDNLISSESFTPPDGLQLAADAVIDMLCLGHCQVNLGTAHSNFVLYGAKVSQLLGNTTRQLAKDAWDHEFGPSYNCLLNFN